MRRCVLLLAVVVSSIAASSTPIVDPDALLDHIKFLASDDMRGRANGSPELERAGDYIAQQFKGAGLQPGGKDGGWFQPFELVAGVTVGKGNTLTIESNGRKVALTLGTSYYPLSAPANDSAAVPSAKADHLPLVFAGYGLDVPNVGYNDYAKIDVNGKAVLIFSHEPQEHDTSSRLNGARPVPQSTLQAKASVARNHGARMLIVVSDPSHRTDEANYRMFAIDPEADDEGIPVLRARLDEMRPLVEAWGLEAVARAIDQDLMPRSQPLKGATIDYEEHLTKNRRIVRNVVGILPGSDPTRSKEVVVIGAHYDHVGLGGRLSVTPERTGEIHNGADDNASGTSSVMEIARVAAAERGRFPRTLVFVAFAGEERGLLGSAHYAVDPALPIENTVAMLNLDMVGRSKGGVDVSGLDSAPSLEADFTAASRSVSELEIRRAGPGAGRSDDASFLDRRVPAINFFTGFHRDYHRPTDDWDKIDAPGTARVATLALEFAARIAERPARPEFVQK
jgi:Peptidase family M28